MSYWISDGTWLMMIRQGRSHWGCHTLLIFNWSVDLLNINSACQRRSADENQGKFYMFEYKYDDKKRHHVVFLLWIELFLHFHIIRQFYIIQQFHAQFDSILVETFTKFFDHISGYHQSE